MYISDRLYQLLDSVPSTIGLAQVLKSGENHAKVDYLDLDIDRDKKVLSLTYLPTGRTAGLGEVWTSPLRQKARIGATIKKITDGSDSQVARLVDYLKKEVLESDIKVELLDAKHIPDCYLESNYHPRKGSSTLAGSCMRHAKCKPYFALYTKNPQVVSILVAKRDDKIVARALHWKALLDKRPITVLDRIYYIQPMDEHALIEWAKANTDIYKKNGLFWCENDRPCNNVLHVKLKHWDCKNPYLDTFRFLIPKLGILSTDGSHLATHCLSSQTGAPSNSTPTVDEVKGKVYYYYDRRWLDPENAIEYQNVVRPKDNYVKCEICDDYLYKEVTFPRLTNGKHLTICLYHMQTDKNGVGVAVELNGVSYTLCKPCNRLEVTKDLKGDLCTACDAKAKPCSFCKKKEAYIYSYKNNKYCRDCKMKHIATCYNCSGSFPKEAMRFSTTQKKLGYCPKCAKAYVKPCFFCEKDMMLHLDATMGFYRTANGKTEVATAHSECSKNRTGCCNKCGLRCTKEEIEKDKRGYCGRCTIKYPMCTVCLKVTKDIINGICLDCDEPFA